MSPALCMDARMLGKGGTGVATYARAVRRAQLAIDPGAALLSAPESQGRNPIGRLAGSLGRRTRSAVRDDNGFAFPDLFRRAHVHFTIHRRLLTIRLPGPPGLIHWSYPVPLRVEGWRNAYTVHDAIPLVRPDLSPVDALRHRRVLDAIVQTAARIVTVSESARAEIACAIGYDPRLIVNCGQPVEVGYVPQPPPHDLVAQNYLLVCGTLEPRKNIVRLLAAHRASGVALPLVVAGPDGWRADRLAPLVAEAPDVIRLPYLDRPQLLALMAHARAVLMPSLAEGFGLPAAEAMALGVPVLASRTGALAEVAGGAALTVDPEEVNAIATGIRRLVDDEPLRAELVRRGRARAQDFTPEVFGARLADLYADMFARPAV